MHLPRFAANVAASLVVGSLVMIMLNVIFYGSNFATMFLAASTAVNLVFFVDNL